MTQCPICNKTLFVEALKCNHCSIEYRGKIHASPLCSLKENEQYLVEMLIVHGGNLKEIAKTMKISYPTLKKRLSKLSETFSILQQNNH